jgi:hypothetical protein
MTLQLARPRRLSPRGRGCYEARLWMPQITGCIVDDLLHGRFVKSCTEHIAGRSGADDNRAGDSSVLPQHLTTGAFQRMQS